MAEERTQSGEVERTAGEDRLEEEPISDKWAMVIAVVRMAIFLTWIGCAIAVWVGWAT